MLPRVNIHTVISADGRIVDGDLHDPIAARLPSDAVLVSAATILAAADADGHDMSRDDAPGAPPPRAAAHERPLLVVADQYGLVRRWNWLRVQPHWRDVLVGVTGDTPIDHLGRLRRHGVRYVVAGATDLDVAGLLDVLARRYGVTHVRVGSHGLLSRALLRGQLADELSIVIEPHLAGSLASHPFGPLGPVRPVDLVLTHVERLDSDQVWLRYRVMNKRWEAQSDLTDVAALVAAQNVP